MRADNEIVRMLVIATAVILMIVGCQTVLGTPVSSQADSQRDQVRFEQDTSLRIERYVVPEGDRPMELCVRIALVAGHIRWQITDPLEQRMSDRGSATQNEPYRAAHCFEATSGVWAFEADLADASGQYEVAWRALAPDSAATDYLWDLH